MIMPKQVTLPSPTHTLANLVAHTIPSLTHIRLLNLWHIRFFLCSPVTEATADQSALPLKQGMQINFYQEPSRCK